ncbi:HalOD1 output domain-containing protein [Saliphagus sp. GCM10025334]
MTDTEAHDRYYPEDDQALSDAILQVIDVQKDESLTEAEFRLYDDIDPDALNNRFQEDAHGETKVEFYTGGFKVTLWGDAVIDIHVTPQQGEGQAANA